MRRLAVLAVLMLQGCLVGRDERGVVIEGTVDRPSRFATGMVRIDDHGFAWFDVRRLHLPRGLEDQRWGVVLLDTAPLPPGWRLPFAPDGGIVVAVVDAASPLAIAGLRPFDVLLNVDGVPPSDVAGVIAALERSAAVKLEVRRPGGAVETVAAVAGEGLLRSTGVEVFPVSVETSATGAYFDVLPSVLHVASGLRYVRGRGYADWVHWGALLDLVTYQSWTDAVSGETSRRLRLGWLLYFGDRPWEEDRWWVSD